MKVFASLQEASDGSIRGSALCLGNFDGVHLGHQALFAEAAKHGPVAALTFEPHPGKVLQPQLAPRLIVSLARKLELLTNAGVQVTVIQPFSIEYARTPPEAFEASLFDRVGARTVIAGYDFAYGLKRAGTLETLQLAAASRGAQVKGVSAVSVEGVVVSSSKIREFILEGRVEAAQRLLGRPFDLEGPVVRGFGRGRTLGFPTANVETTNELRPATGVYAVRVAILGGPEAPWHGGAANIGVKPTFDGEDPTLEVHLLDFDGDLYGKVLRVQFLERLRAEKRFGSAAELHYQISRDLQVARASIARSGS